jgi:hypothetical protein
MGQYAEPFSVNGSSANLTHTIAAARAAFKCLLDLCNTLQQRATSRQVHFPGDDLRTANAQAKIGSVLQLAIQQRQLLLRLIEFCQQ